MKTAFLPTFAVVLCFVLLAGSCAREDRRPVEEKKSVEDEKVESKARLRSFTGEVTNIDAVAKTLTVRRAKGEETFDMSSISGSSKIKMGKRVTVKYSEQDGRKVAKTVKPAKSRKTAKKRAKETA